MSEPAGRANPIAALGARLLGGLSYLGGMALLLGETARRAWQQLARPKGRAGQRALRQQMVRVGVRSVGIVCLVQVFIGVILALQMAPPLEPWGRNVASVVHVRSLRKATATAATTTTKAVRTITLRRLSRTARTSQREISSSGTDAGE